MSFFKKRTKAIGLRKVFFTRTRPPFLVRLLGGGRWVRLAAEWRWRKLLNYSAAELSRWLGLSYFPARPYFLSLEPTDNCQLHCPFCEVFYAKGERHVLPYADYEKFMREFGPWLVRAELYKGGESFLHPRITDMIRLAKSYDAEVTVSSNLNALPQGGAAELVGSGLDVLVASIDGATQAAYEKYRAGGDLARVLENAQAIAKAKRELGSKTPELIWQFIVFRHNQDELDAAVELARRAGFDQIMFRPGYFIENPEVRAAWRTTLPEFREEKLCSDDGTCNWPWGGVNVFSDGSVTLCYVDRARRYGLGEAGRLAQEMRGGKFYRSARAIVERWESGEAGRRQDGHPCESCPSFGKSNFWV